jgi:hypothetical protein
LSVSFRQLVVLPLAGSPSPSPSLSYSSPTSPLPGENDSSWLGPGLLGFLSLVFLAVAVFVIWKSLNKQLKRVTFDEDTVNADAGGGAGAAAPLAADVTAKPTAGGPHLATEPAPTDPPGA